MNRLQGKWTSYVSLLATVLVVFSLTNAFSAFDVTEVNHYNSYSLQAGAWLEGHLDIGEDYSHLEIATYKGKYYISFPPFPSVVMVPFVLLFGHETPDHLIAIGLGLIASIYAFKIALIILKDEKRALFWTLFLIVASNYVHVALWGAVWYMAQNMAFTWTLMAIYFALTPGVKDTKWSLLFMSFALGCRPLNLVYIPCLLVLLYRRYKESGHKSFIGPLIVGAIPAITVGVLYMVLNVLRFDSVFEFGHNYLPEFLEDKQFGIAYIGQNMGSMLTKLPEFSDRHMLSFPKFNGVAMWLVSPIWIPYVVYLLLGLKGALLEKSWPDLAWLMGLFLTLVLHMLFIASHKTMGGYHFGNRYTLDFLPFAFYGLTYAVAGRKSKPDTDYLWMPLLIGGLVINVVGSVLFWSL